MSSETTLEESLLMGYVKYISNNLKVNMSKRSARRAYRSIMERIFWESVFKGINPHPDTYTAEELKHFCPEIPPDFIDDHVAKRNKN